ncbi:hypothetical protein HMPREF3038_00378 [Akkermansia sp. KLE1797]|jgi:hypothetical protein|nr:hypothetical protein HMPREF3038_00378 [Akkermansia sp. KLE1797]KZA04340.1 hypothetical protein HMPREF1326_02008 [Akkermansia sp. KLE1605]
MPGDSFKTDVLPVQVTRDSIPALFRKRLLSAWRHVAGGRAFLKKPARKEREGKKGAAKQRS